MINILYFYYELWRLTNANILYYNIILSLSIGNVYFNLRFTRVGIIMVIINKGMGNND